MESEVSSVTSSSCPVVSWKRCGAASCYWRCRMLKAGWAWLCMGPALPICSTSSGPTCLLHPRKLWALVRCWCLPSPQKHTGSPCSTHFFFFLRLLLAMSGCSHVCLLSCPATERGHKNLLPSLHPLSNFKKESGKKQPTNQPKNQCLHLIVKHKRHS